MRLGAATFRELANLADAHLLIPLGATEQHGPHLPLETDTLIARGVCDAVAATRADVVVAPALPYGSSGEHAAFPGTLSLGQAGLETAVLELVRSADGFGDVTLIAWHRGNAEPLSRAVARLRAEGRAVVEWVPRVAGGDAHAGWVETSLVLELAPHLVGDERPVGVIDAVDRLLPALREHGVRAVAENGVLGDARGASAAKGRDLLSRFVADVCAVLDAGAEASRSR